MLVCDELDESDDDDAVLFLKLDVVDDDDNVDDDDAEDADDGDADSPGELDFDPFCCFFFGRYL